MSQVIDFSEFAHRGRLAEALDKIGLNNHTRDYRH
jgi:hypothetical protein